MSRHSKKIYDALHGFIGLDSCEWAFVSHAAFRRLIDVHQLGTAYLVYPGATHSRYEHSLGTMHVVSHLFDRFIERKVELEALQELYSNTNLYRKLVRMAALCHDVGHLPYSHTAEHLVFGDQSHEWMTYQILRDPILDAVFQPIESECRSAGIDGREMIIKLAIGPEKMGKIAPSLAKFSPVEKILSQMITDDFFGADRIDYLLRDGRCTGVPYGEFDYLQLIEMITVVESDQGGYSLAIEEEGLQACESLLLARYFMFNRIYQHPHVKALAFHLARIIDNYAQVHKITESVADYLEVSDSTIWHTVKTIARDSSHPLYCDSRALLSPSHSYKVIKLTTEHLREVEKMGEYGVTMFAEVGPFSHQSSTLDFCVHRKNNSVALAHQISDLRIPSPEHHLLYIENSAWDRLSKDASSGVVNWGSAK